MTPIRNFLIVFNWREGTLDHWRDIDREISDNNLTGEEARAIYKEYERRFRQADGYEVVLIGADSIDTIRRTHGHYFGRINTEPFLELLADPATNAEPPEPLSARNAGEASQHLSKGSGTSSHDPELGRIDNTREQETIGSRRITGIVQQSVVLTEDAHIDGVIQASVHIQPPAVVNLHGRIQGSTLVEPGARLVINGAQEGSLTVRPGAEVLVEASGKLAGSLWNDGKVVVRGVFGGAEGGSAQVELEGNGWIKAADQVLSDGTRVYRW